MLIIFLPLSVYLIGSSIALLRTSNAELFGVGEFKIVSSIFLAGFLIATPLVSLIWSYKISEYRRIKSEYRRIQSEYIKIRREYKHENPTH